MRGISISYAFMINYAAKEYTFCLLLQEIVFTRCFLFSKVVGQFILQISKLEVWLRDESVSQPVNNIIYYILYINL